MIFFNIEMVIDDSTYIDFVKSYNNIETYCLT